MNIEQLKKELGIFAQQIHMEQNTDLSCYCVGAELLTCAAK